jgi:hypothetical protein
MNSLQTPPVASPPDSSSLQNGSPIKSVFSQNSLGEDSAAHIQNAPNAGSSQLRPATGATASSSRDKQNQKRLSQVVPQRPKDKELVNEEEPWVAKNVLSFGMMAQSIECSTTNSPL